MKEDKFSGGSYKKKQSGKTESYFPLTEAETIKLYQKINKLLMNLLSSKLESAHFTGTF